MIRELDLGGKLCRNLCGERGLRVFGLRLRAGRGRRGGVGGVRVRVGMGVGVGVRVGVRGRRVLHHLLVDELLPLLHGVLALVHAVVVRQRRRRVDLALIVPHVDVRMQQRVIDRDAPLRVDDQHPREKVPRLRRLEPVVLVAVAGEEDVGEEPLEGVSGVARAVLDVVAHGGLQARHEGGRGRAQLLDDLVPLVDVVRAREQHAAADHLAHYAPHRPDVHVLRVAHAQDHLWCTIISGDDVWRHHEGRASGAGEAEVQNLQRAVALYHYIGRFQVPVNDPGKMQVLNAAQHLI